MANINVVVQDANNVQLNLTPAPATTLIAEGGNNVILELTPTPTQVITLDRGVAGVGIESITVVTIDGDQYLHITFTNGSTSDVGPISATSYTGVTPIVVNNTTNQISLDTVPVAFGGTGATTASGARTNLGLGSAAVLTAGAALGAATLDAGGTVPLSQIPASIQGGLIYQGTWNASTNTPTLTSSIGTKGHYYVVSVAGSTNLNGITDWNIGDLAVFNGSVWEQIDNTDAVTSVNGQTGAVVLNANDVGALSDVTSTDGSVTITTPSTGVRDLSVAIAGATTNVLCLVRNTTGATLTKGTVVYISGATGQNPTVSKAIATSDATSAQTLGVMTADLANNSNGYVTVIGLVTDIDTSAYTDGQQLYLSGTTAGALTGTKPYAPVHLVYVAIVEHAHPTQGKLFVKVQNGYELDEIHNVSAQTPTNGQTIVYNSATSLWEQSNAPVISGTTIDNTVIGGTTPAAGTFTTLTATGQTSLGGAAGSEGLRVVTTASGVNWVQVAGSVTTSNPVISVQGSDTNPGLYVQTKGTGTLRFTTNSSLSTVQMAVAHTASAVNYVQVTGGATGAKPTISAQGSDANVGLTLTAKGAGDLLLSTASISGWSVLAPNSIPTFAATAVTSAVNYWQAKGGATTYSPILGVTGTDTNISQVFQPKGTGAIDLAAGSSGVNISNGGTITAITRTNAGASYTGVPSVAISAPTTAGGIQATATCTLGASGSVTVNSGGTGYTVGDTLTVVGGTGTATTIVVGAVSGGVITSYSAYGNIGAYSVAPTFPASTTGGTGSGATVTLNLTVNSTFTITNAGSGYVEQPTVSFSGGGGSGAAAYATVGSNVSVKGLGNSIDFYVPDGIGFRVSGASSAGGAYWMTFAGATTPIIRAIGSASGIVETGSAVPIQFRTNGSTSGVEQFRVAHTASAVNYVQVTGATTGGIPALSAQGSDSNISLQLRSKGSGYVFFYTASGAQFAVIDNGTTASNYATVKGSATGVAPTFSVAGSDTNIDLALTPKGTGVVQFGAYTATGSDTFSIAGYITIRDAGGTLRKLAVIA
jgi:hypothetical protein